MDKQVIEMKVGETVSRLTAQYLSEGLVLTRVEHGGLNNAYQVLIFFSSNKDVAKVIFVEEDFVKMLSISDAKQFIIYTAIMSKEDTRTGFIDELFEKAEKDVCDEFFMINSTGRCPQVVESRKELEEISELRMKRIAQKGTSQHSFSVKKLKTVSGYKRQGATVTRLSGGRLKYRIAGEKQGSKIVAY